MGEQNSLGFLLIFINEFIFKNFEEIRIEMIFVGFIKKKEKKLNFFFDLYFNFFRIGFFLFYKRM